MPDVYLAMVSLFPLLWAQQYPRENWGWLSISLDPDTAQSHSQLMTETQQEQVGNLCCCKPVRSWGRLLLQRNLHKPTDTAKMTAHTITIWGQVHKRNMGFQRRKRSFMPRSHQQQPSQNIFSFFFFSSGLLFCFTWLCFTFSAV